MSSCTSMNIIALNEETQEKRVSLTPAIVEKLSKLGATVSLEKDFGRVLGFSDEAYEKAGASLLDDAHTELESADLVIGLNVPTDEVVDRLKKGVMLASYLDPFRNPDLVKKLSDKGISALCMELIPRSTYAQKMDALSSQASLAGYAAVLIAAERINKALPMMSTPAGTIAPARVFIIGVGVAGLQAIATAKRLGARVEAYDTRPVVEEQVKSLGAKFVKIDVGETGQTEQGYAKQLTEEQLEKQRQQMARTVGNSDIVITTAQLFGRPAPRIVSADMVAGMKAGSVIVDLAASTGGNVEGSVAGEEVDVNGVRIVGMNNFPGEVAKDASQMYASNVYNLIDHLWDKPDKDAEEDAPTGINLESRLESEDDILNACLLTHNGEIRDERIRNLIETK